MNKIIAISLALVSAVSVPAFAAGPDFTTLTDGIDFSTTTAAIMAVAVSAVLLVLTMVGIKKVVSFVRSI